ncbi:MAG: hypothetical protein JO190_07440 [Candidatus Eremiobacteraeota bacterium]|nr:hypothetical protein [Candidatus Eremiobacteraeota bacterium]MBV8497784.1 hypothetical protein [Candidatus Eremiobacteraeota bacterium]
MRRQRSGRTLYEGVAVAALGFVVIAPALWSGWLGDDAFYSVLNGILGADHISLWQAMRHSFDLWFLREGRFYPGLILEKYLVFYVFTNLLAYKVLLVAATLATLEMFRRCVAAYATQGLANLAALIAITLFAERGYHDSILSYNAMPQFVAILLLGSLLAFRRVLDDGATGPRVLSTVLYAAAALTYEEAYGLCLLYPIVAAAKGRSWRDALRESWPYLAIAGALTAFSLAARAVVRVPAGSLYAFNAAPAPLLRTLGEQIAAALPLSYYLFDPSHIFSHNDFHDFYNNAPMQPAIFVAFALAAAYALAQAVGDGGDSRGPAAVGIAVLVLAAAPIAAVVKYQHELLPGLGYLPVLYEAFGVALALAALAAETTRRIRGRWYRLAWIAAIAIVGTMTQATNVRVVREDQASRDARSALESQLDAGLLLGVRSGTLITMVPPQDWIAYDGQGPDGISTRGLFYLHGKSRIRLVDPGDARASIAVVYHPAARRWSAGTRPP